MRALFHPFDFNDQKELVINDEGVHHLNVVRARTNDPLLLLNGRGGKLQTVIKSIEKKQVIVEVKNFEQCEKQNDFVLAIALPKKDAFEDILKMAVELGVQTIVPLSSQYSQYDYIESERTARLVESALVQSNNPWFPEIKAQKKLAEFLHDNSLPLAFFNSLPSTQNKNELPIVFPIVILIGPEGGFSDEEIHLIKSQKNVMEVHLPTPILRAPTAVCASIGYFLALKN